jgi:hypothetical protein
LSQEANKHIDTLAGGTFFMLNAKEVRALFEKLSASERDFQGMALTQPAVSEMHQAKQEILAQPSDGKKMPISRISSDAILD